MKKIMLMIVGTIGLVLISCGIAQKNSGSTAISKTEPVELVKNVSQKIGSQDPARGLSSGVEIREAQKGNSKTPEPNLDSEAENPITQYDSEKLDKEVTELALKLKEDPKTFRMLIRTGEDGAKIYRMIGMHVIVNPQGDEVFLPDAL